MKTKFTAQDFPKMLKRIKGKTAHGYCKLRSCYLFRDSKHPILHYVATSQLNCNKIQIPGFKFKFLVSNSWFQIPGFKFCKMQNTRAGNLRADCSNKN